MSQQIQAMDLQRYLNPSTLPATATILAGFVFVVYHLLWSRKRRQTPPKARGAWPIIGHLPLFTGPQPAHKTLALMADKHGPIFTVRMGVHTTVVVSSSETAKECFTTNDKALANRPKGMASEVLAYNYAAFGISPHGPYWRQTRKFATLQLLSNHRLESLCHVRESEVRTAIKDLYELSVNNSKSGGNNLGLEMKKWFGDITLNVILRNLIGKRYLEATSGNDAKQFRKAFSDFFHLFGMYVVSDAIPWLRWLDLGGHEKAMKETAKVLDRLLGKWLEEHKRKRDSGEVDGDHDFMDVMLSMLDGAEFGNSSYDSDTVNKATVLTILLAGTDTTTLTMTWVLSVLLNNRKVLAKAQQELDQHVGRERRVKESDLKNLVYLQAIIKETLRLYPAGPLALPHEAIEDCTVAGYHIKAGTRLLVNIWKIQRDPKAWPEPDEFRPERFLSGEGSNVDVRGQYFDLIPFGTGRRMCPGVSFALQFAPLALAAFLQGFDITTPSDEPVDMRELAGLTNHKATPLDVLITPRLPAEAY